MTKVPQDSSKKPRIMVDKHKFQQQHQQQQQQQHCVPDDNEDLMILAECALHSVSSPTFMSVPSSPSFSSPNSYPPSPMSFSPHSGDFMTYDQHPLQVEFTKDFIITLQSCIEKCLQEQLTMQEACTAIYYQCAIDPRVTEIVWRKLEEENPSYFKDYSSRLQHNRHTQQASIF
jgi:uncharacterized protein (TIGR01589 family)